MGRSTALRLSKKAELLDRRLNVHMRPTSIAHPGDLMIAELEGTTPVIAELEGSRPVLPELEGDTPETPVNAVQARVFPASAVKTVNVKAKRISKRFFSFRPDKTQYDVQCSNAAADLAKAEREKKDKLFLADKFNACRRSQGLAPLQVNDELSAHAQQHADNLPAPYTDFLPSPTGPVVPRSPLGPRPDTVTTVPSPLERRQSVARLVSDRGLGAMACVERWYGGKYRRHVLHVGGREAHTEDCPCRLAIVYDTMMSPSFTKMGVGRATEGAGVWVVELAA